MTPLVVDSSVVIKWFIPELLSATAIVILDDYQLGKYSFLAPDFLNAEVGNIIWKKQSRQILSPDAAQRAIDAFQDVPFELTSTADLLEDAYQLAVTYQRTVYDMLYVALSLREHCSFVTADEKLANSLKNRIDSVIWLGNWS